MKRSFQLFLIAVVLAAAAPMFAQLSIPEIPYDGVDPLKMPDRLYMGEAVGVATNSRGHIFVYTRTGHTRLKLGTARTFSGGGSRLFEFDQNGTFVRELGQNAYGFNFAHAVRVDPQDNIWVVDEGANVVMKFNPEGRIVMVMGRKPEALRVPAPHAAPPAPLAPMAGPPAIGPVPPGAPPAPPAGGPGGGAALAATGAGVPGDNFNRPTDVAWDAAGNIFVSDGYGNARVAKFDKNGAFIKSWGQRGTEPGQFNTLHSIATDAKGNVYVGDRGNRRIQVFDNDGTFKTQYLNVGAPWALCITPGPHQYLYTSNSNSTSTLDNGEIYKMELDGRVVGKFGRAGKMLKEFGSVHEIDCRNENELYLGEIINWRVQKVTLRAAR